MRIYYKLIFVGLLVLFSILSVSSMWNNSYTDNEAIYIFQGYSYLVNGESFNSGHPIMTGLISAVPLLFINIDYPPYSEVYHVQRYARNEFLYYGNNNPDEIIFLSRLPFIVLAIIFGVYVFKWANDLYGAKSGLFALFIYVLNPDIISNATLVMTDLPVAGFMLICLYYYWRYLKNHEEKFRNLLLSGIFFGVAICTKSTALFLLPLLIILPLLYNTSAKSIFKNFLLILLIGSFTFTMINIRDISPIYTDDNPFYQSNEFRSYNRLDTLLPIVTNNKLIGSAIKYILTKIPIPGSNSIQPYLVQILHTEIGHPQYFLESYTTHGVWYYYFVVYLIKLPIALILLFILSFIYFNRIRSDAPNEIYLITIISVIFIIVSFIMKLNLGLRHTLIIHLIGFVLLSKVIRLTNQKGLLRMFIILLSLWYIISAILIYPYYLSYFNEFVGGPDNGYKYLVDSSLDLGQDLKRLGFYLDQNPMNDIKLKYAGFEKPGSRGISYQNLTCNPTTGNIIISASALEGILYHEGKNTPDLGCYAWLRQLGPVDKIGYSIFIYNVTEKDLMDIGSA